MRDAVTPARGSLMSRDRYDRLGDALGARRRRRKPPRPGLPATAAGIAGAHCGEQVPNKLAEAGLGIAAGDQAPFSCSSAWSEPAGAGGVALSAAALGSCVRSPTAAFMGVEGGHAAACTSIPRA